MPSRVVVVEDHAESAEGLAALLTIWGTNRTSPPTVSAPSS